MTDTIINLETVNPIEFFGVNNRKLDLLKKKFPLLKILSRGTQIKLSGAPEQIDLAKEKIDLIVANYIDMLIINQDLPIFVLSEIRNHPEKFANKMQAASLMANSSFVRQLHERVPHLNPLHFLMSIIGITVFPFVGKPIFQSATSLDSKMFDGLMEERKRLIPIWVKAMIGAS